VLNARHVAPTLSSGRLPSPSELTFLGILNLSRRCLAQSKKNIIIIMSSQRQADTRSSFAQSFFQGGSSDDGSSENDVQKLAAITDESSNQNAFPIPASRPPSRRSVLSRRSSSDSMDIAAAAQAFPKEDQRASWYADALRVQGDEANLKEFLTDATNQQEQETFGDKEVLEQYRIMAQCEARLRVKENIGFDLDEYEATHKLSTPKVTDKKAIYGGTKKSKFRLPECKRTFPSTTTLVTEEPPLLPPCPDPKLVLQKGKRAVPELQMGIVTRGDIPADHHTVRCLHCRCSLQVNQLATLVSCPECHVVSPASSTRR